jgi:hypothetical protein
MPLAQVIRFEERQVIGQSRRTDKPWACVILQFPKKPAPRARKVAVQSLPDEDRVAGRGRDPG